MWLPAVRSIVWLDLGGIGDNVNVGVERIKWNTIPLCLGLRRVDKNMQE